MSSKSPNVTCSEKDEGIEEKNDKSKSPVKALKCHKLFLDKHIEDYIFNIKRESQVESLKCNNDLIEKVMLNYIIVKQILSNLSWQDKLLCKHVCSTWHSAVQTLKKEQLGPIDFVIDICPNSVTAWTSLKKSSNFSIEPLVVMTFVNTAGLCVTCQCNFIDPTPCVIPCKNNHSLLDMMQKYSCAPKDCMNVIQSDYLSYMPLPNSVTFQHTITNLKINPYIVGLSIPVIPDVRYHTINIKSNDDMQRDFYKIVDEIAKGRIFKGIIVFVTDKYLLRSVEDIVFLNHFKDIQPDIPYALGGCIIEDTIFGKSDINCVIEGINELRSFSSENLISIGMFTIPKDQQGNEQNFDMFSVVLEPSQWAKPKIQQAITEFAKKVPQFEHSIVFKLSCVGRDHKHKWEQDCFRAAFPNTRLIGCYGNGELGINHPEKPPEETPPTSAKRHCGVSGPQFGIVYSYSTVFVYMGWGKILSNGSL